jgi:ribosomal protein L7/L12
MMSMDYEVTQLNARVMELEGKVDFLMKHLGLHYETPVSEADLKVAEALKRGNMIEAIKVYREIYNVDLTSAKQAVDGIKSKLNL